MSEVKRYPELIISTGGRGTRIREYVNSIEDGLPKQLLPIPTEDQTLLHAVVNNARSCFDRFVMSTNEHNASFIKPLFENDTSVEVEIDTEHTGPMGPYLRSLREKKEITFGCVGDFYCDFSWDEFINFHQSHERPISILAAKSVPTKGGARFNIENGAIVSWERVSKTFEEDNINMGAYIIDPSSDLIDQLHLLPTFKEDPFFDLFIPQGMVAGYDPGVPGFNINTPEVYRALTSHLTK